MPVFKEKNKTTSITTEYKCPDFFVVVGDYRECQIVVWSTFTCDILATYVCPAPIHALQWDPYMCNEFASVGAQGSIMFWLLDETGSSAALSVHEAKVPREIEMAQHGVGVHAQSATLLPWSDGIFRFILNSGSLIGNSTFHMSYCFLGLVDLSYEIGSKFQIFINFVFKM